MQTVLGFQGISPHSIKSDIFSPYSPFDVLAHNNSAALITGNNVCAIESERIDRIKDSAGVMPLGGKVVVAGAIPAISYCLGTLNLKQADFGFCLDCKEFNHAEKFVKNKLVNLSKTTKNSHHITHASSAFYPSEFDSAAAMVIDGCGDIAHFFAGEGIKLNKIEVLDKSKYKHNWGIGEVWLAHHLLMGLKEEKIMGLSAHGNADKFKDKKLFWLEGNEVVINEELSSCKFKHDVYSHYEGTYPDLLKEFYGIDVDPRKVEDFAKSIYAHIAAKLQKDTEEIVLSLANKLFEETKESRLCYAGGLALNGLVNRRIVLESPFKKVFIQPAANDGGIGLGCAFYGYYHYLENKRDRHLKNTFLGRAYEKQYPKFIENLSYKIQAKKIKNPAKKAAQLISKGYVIGWFQGRSEFGPRALGNRSILADPRTEKSRERINSKIKYRYWWQPLAPAVLKDHVKDYFEKIYDAPYMLIISNVKESVRDKVPAIVHADGTSRLQTVKKGTLFYDLIKEFYEITGIPIVLNTSFNRKGEPIVDTPAHAINCFLSSPLDYLIMGDYFITKQNIV